MLFRGSNVTHISVMRKQTDTSHQNIRVASQLTDPFKEGVHSLPTGLHWKIAEKMNAILIIGTTVIVTAVNMRRFGNIRR